MPAQTVATAGGGILSKLGGLKSIAGKIPRLFTYAFVIFIFISTVSQGWNKMQETGNPMDFAVSFGKAFIKPLVAADSLIGESVAKFNGNLTAFQIIGEYLTLFGAITVLYFILNWSVIGMKSLIPEGMNSSAAIYGLTLFILFLLSTTYHSLSSGNLSFGFEGLYSLFTHFSAVFHPIISIGERFLGITNALPDGDVPIFVS